MTSVDTTFDVRTDAHGGDPDRYSATLRRYHQLLWSKPLPTGHQLELTFSPYPGLELRSELGDFYVTSDGMINTYFDRPCIYDLGPLITPELVSSFETIASTIGGYIVFPGEQIDRKWTINQARGMIPSINDRFDLTLECIRRHYLGLASPLSDVLARYAGFFDLFGDFSGYTAFFLLQDLVRDGSVVFFLPFTDFTTSPLPESDVDYLALRDAAVAFLVARNNRIAQLGPSVSTSD